MLHIVLHLLVPLAFALTLYGRDWKRAALIMVATMIVDADHLLADPIYDPARCSIGFHPLHGGLAIAAYVVLFALPLVLRYRRPDRRWRDGGRVAHLIGLGLLIHMALDAIDCAV